MQPNYDYILCPEFQNFARSGHISKIMVDF